MSIAFSAFLLLQLLPKSIIMKAVSAYTPKTACAGAKFMTEGGIFHREIIKYRRPLL